MSHLASILKQHKSLDGQSMYDHLVELLDQIANEPNRFSNDLTFFELLSDFIKKNSFSYRNLISDSQANSLPSARGDHDQWINKCHALINDYKKAPKLLPLIFQDFLQDSRSLEWAGISFGEEQNYRITQSLKKLAGTSKAQSLRFWGKILCRKGDYYVVEGLTSSQNADQLPKDCEQKGEGVNAFSYWVSYNVLDEWIELPLVTPEQVRVARKIKYIFTGDLNSELKFYPVFPGREKHLLRAQIARISSATVLAPQGLYKTEDEKPREITYEDFGESGSYQAPEYSELKSLDSWLHLHPALLGLGRTTHYVDPTLPEEEKEQITAELTDKDPEIERLKGISDQKLPYGTQEEALNWTVREVGDLMTYNKQDQANNYGAIIVRNMTWPGAVCVASSNGWTNIYVGYGLKINQTPFQPLGPDDTKEEGEDGNEHSEPNPSKAPVIPPPEEAQPDGEGAQGAEGGEAPPDDN